MISIARRGVLALAAALFCGGILVGAEHVDDPDLSQRLAVAGADSAAAQASDADAAKPQVQPAAYETTNRHGTAAGKNNHDADVTGLKACDYDDDQRCSVPDYLLDTSCPSLADGRGGNACESKTGECCSDCGCCDDGACDSSGGKLYADVQVMWLRAHVNEDAVGKLSESYDITPRFVLGYEDEYGVGARLRLWHYAEDLDILGGGNDQVRFEFGVLDVEGTKRIRFLDTDVTLSGGARFADVELTDDDGDVVDNSMLGLTVAADVRTRVAGSCRSDLALVCGVRWSILGGDWEGDAGHNLTGGTVRDDNLLVQEIYGGVEWSCGGDGYDVFTRLVWEMQNWHSDVLAQNASTDTIGFVGPGVHFGLTF